MINSENIDFYILSLSQKTVSIFKLHDTTTEEIRDGIFPMSSINDYEYSKSSRGTSYGYALKNFEKDKSIVKKERFKRLLRDVNEKLKRYLNNESALLIAGTNEDRSDFKKISDYNHLLVDEISGSFSSKNLGQLKQWVNTIKDNLN